MITVDVIKDPNGDGKFDFVLKGLSTDNKPIEKYGGNTIADNSLFEEVDTGDKYYYSEGEWHKMSGGGGGGGMPEFPDYERFWFVDGHHIKSMSRGDLEGMFDLYYDDDSYHVIERVEDAETGDIRYLLYNGETSDLEAENPPLTIYLDHSTVEYSMLYNACYYEFMNNWDVPADEPAGS